MVTKVKVNMNPNKVIIPGMNLSCGLHGLTFFKNALKTLGL